MQVDYIVVGAGSAGCALAEGLSRSGRDRVLVLEAGGSDRRFWIDVPLGYGKLFFDPKVNWCYDTEPDPGLNGRRDFWPRGRVLGGSSSINAMVFIRGQAEDFDGWRDAGCVGWGYDDVLPVFKAMETYAAGADDWRGAGGPVPVRGAAHSLHPLSERFIRAGEAVGLTRNADVNGATQEGVGYLQFTIGADGKRCSAAKAFLRPALDRANIMVETGALTTGLIFDGRRCTGVAFEQRGQARTAHAAKGVILCAGAVESPAILMRSGIGPGDDLAALGIPVRHANAQVGRNLQDHLGMNYVYRSRVPTLNGVLRPWWGKALAGARYLATGRGPLSLSINQAGGFVRTSGANDRPNIQLYFQALTTSQTPRAGGERPLMSPDPFEAFALGLSSCRPKSRGRLTLRSARPGDSPRIQPNSFSDPGGADMAEMIEGARLIFRMARTAPLAEVIAAPLDPALETAADAALAADVRARAGTVFHPCGTCRMGADAAESVVDPRLRVHGVDGLRVADASVFPSILSGNLNAAAMMVGRKAADLIAEDAA
jgi:choline dehydrogenase